MFPFCGTEVSDPEVRIRGKVMSQPLNFRQYYGLSGPNTVYGETQGSRSTEFTTEKIVVLAPIPRTSVPIAATVNAGLRRSPRPATIRSEIMGLSASFLQFYAQ